jgi:PAS domain S-box-containing protein
MRFFIAIIFCSNIFFAQAENQQELDSLLNLLQTEKEDTNKVRLLWKIGQKHRPHNLDSSYYYYNAALMLAEKARSTKHIARSYRLLGYLSKLKGEFFTAQEYYYKAADCCEKINDEKGLSITYYQLGVVYSDKSQFDKAIRYYLKSIKYKEKINDTIGIAQNLIGIGNIYNIQSDYQKALSYYQDAIDIYRRYNQKEDLSSVYNNIGAVYFNQQQYDSAIDYYLKSAELYKQINDNYNLPYLYSNIGIVYQLNKDFNTAFKYYFLAKQLLEKNEDKYGIAVIYCNLASINKETKKYHNAIAFAIKSLELAKEIEVLDLQKLSYDVLYSSYDSLGNIGKAYKYHLLYKTINDSIFNLENSNKILELQTSYETEQKEKEIQAQKVELEIRQIKIERRDYLIIGFLAGFIIITVFIIIIIKLYNDKKRKNHTLEIQKSQIEQQNHEIQAQAENLQDAYDELDVKSKLIILQSENLERINKELEKLSIVASETDNLVLIMDKNGKFEWANPAFERFHGYTLEAYISSHSDNIFDTSNNPDIKKIVEKVIETQKSIEYESYITNSEGQVKYIQTTITPIIDNETKAITKLIAIDADITKIKDSQVKINNQNKLITDSIIYAQTIQQAILPIKDKTDDMFDSFIFFRPKDIVSGDFYWFADFPEDNEIIVGVIDCTGHGVPGAFMSMIGNNMLHEIVIQKEIKDPAKIIYELDKGVIHRLKQEYTDNMDGMDLVICKINYNGDKRTIEYCGASRPLIYYSQNKEDLMIDKGWCKTVGGVHFMQDKLHYTTRSIELDKGDFLYLTSDGFISQMNTDMKRFGSKKFLQLLKNIAKHDFGKQQQILEKEFAEFKLQTEQYDDVTVWGIKL